MTEYVSDFKYNDLNIKISFNVEESKKHIVDDLNVINNEGIDKIISEKFIPWLKGEQFKDSDDEKIKAGLSLYEVQYHYNKICKEYSPTGKEDYFGQQIITYLDQLFKNLMVDRLELKLLLHLLEKNNLLLKMYTSHTYFKQVYYKEHHVVES